MSGSKQRGWRTYWGILLLCGALTAGLGTTAPTRRALTTANHFLTYYRALDRTSVRPNFWNRVALSLALARTERLDSCRGAPTS